MSDGPVSKQCTSCTPSHLAQHPTIAMPARNAHVGRAPPQVFPLVHTFPAYDESQRTWIDSTCSHCPATTKLLQGMPNVRTALFSRLGAGSRIAGHRGWADLANHVLRCHLPLIVPVDGPCGLWVDGEVRACVLLLRRCTFFCRRVVQRRDIQLQIQLTVFLRHVMRFVSSVGVSASADWPATIRTVEHAFSMERTRYGPDLSIPSPPFCA